MLKLQFWTVALKELGIYVKAAHLQASDLLPEVLLLLGHDALVQLSVGLHDGVLGRQHRQHFLKIKILTRERQPQSNTQTDTRTTAMQTTTWQTHSKGVKSQMASRKPTTNRPKQPTYANAVRAHMHIQTHAYNQRRHRHHEGCRKKGRQQERKQKQAMSVSSFIKSCYTFIKRSTAMCVSSTL